MTTGLALSSSIPGVSKSVRALNQLGVNLTGSHSQAVKIPTDQVTMHFDGVSETSVVYREIVDVFFQETQKTPTAVSKWAGKRLVNVAKRLSLQVAHCYAQLESDSNKSYVAMVADSIAIALFRKDPIKIHSLLSEMESIQDEIPSITEKQKNSLPKLNVFLEYFATEGNFVYLEEMACFFPPFSSRRNFTAKTDRIIASYLHLYAMSTIPIHEFFSTLSKVHALFTSRIEFVDSFDSHRSIRDSAKQLEDILRFNQLISPTTIEGEWELGEKV